MTDLEPSPSTPPAAAADGSRPTRVRAEQLSSLIGTDVEAPRLSWWLPSGARTQIGYQIRLEVGGTQRLSARKDSADHAMVPWPRGMHLPRATPGRISVRTWTDVGRSEWSEPLEWERLPPQHWWTARWISPAESKIEPPGRRPVYELRTSFDLGAHPSLARIWATADGLYEIFLNGARVGDHELTPGLTSYRRRLQVQRYDATELAVVGRNEFRIRLSDGWFRGKMGIERVANNFGDRLAFLMQAEILDHSNRALRVTTDSTWTSRASGHTPDLIDGEFAASPGTDDWRPVDVGVVGSEETRLVGMTAPPVRRVERIMPVKMTRPDSRSVVVDFGQNLNGVVRFEAAIPPFESVALRHAEHLGADGHVATDHLRGFDLKTFQPTEAGQRDTCPQYRAYRPVPDDSRPTPSHRPRRRAVRVGRGSREPRRVFAHRTCLDGDPDFGVHHGPRRRRRAHDRGDLRRSRGLASRVSSVTPTIAGPIPGDILDVVLSRQSRRPGPRPTIRAERGDAWVGRPGSRLSRRVWGVGDHGQRPPAGRLRPEVPRFDARYGGCAAMGWISSRFAGMTFPKFSSSHPVQWLRRRAVVPDSRPISRLQDAQNRQRCARRRHRESGIYQPVNQSW